MLLEAGRADRGRGQGSGERGMAFVSRARHVGRSVSAKSPPPIGRHDDFRRWEAKGIRGIALVSRARHVGRSVSAKSPPPVGRHDDFRRCEARATGGRRLVNRARHVGRGGRRRAWWERYPLERADVAQLVEHFTRNEGVRGSNPRVGFSW
jgi:hypothetical protein